MGEAVMEALKDFGKKPVQRFIPHRIAGINGE